MFHKPAFSLNLWDKLLPQSMLALNLLHPSQINPQLSAQAQMHGAFDYYNCTPLTPPGIKVLAHICPKSRNTWAPDAEEGFYLGPALHHYQCHYIWMTKTTAKRFVQTIKWYPHNSITMPTPTSKASTLYLQMTLLLPSNNKTTAPCSHQYQHKHEHYSSI